MFCSGLFLYSNKELEFIHKHHVKHGIIIFFVNMVSYPVRWLFILYRLLITHVQVNNQLNRCTQILIWFLWSVLVLKCDCLKHKREVAKIINFICKYMDDVLHVNEQIRLNRRMGIRRNILLSRILGCSWNVKISDSLSNLIFLNWIDFDTTLLTVSFIWSVCFTSQYVYQNDDVFSDMGKLFISKYNWGLNGRWD